MGSKSTAFIDPTYNDALALLVEARDYAQATHLSPLAADPGDRLLAVREAFRLTTRLTQVMSWLLVRKAVFNGELTAEQAAEPARRLGAQTVCRDDRAHAHPAIPAPMRDLLARSRHLYVRVSRLDDHSRREHGFPRQGMPRSGPPPARNPI